jgi:hypothetical protein
MKPSVLLLMTTCLSVGVSVGVLADRFALRSTDEDLEVLRELREARRAVADLQRSTQQCVRTNLLTSVVRDPSSTGGAETLAQATALTKAGAPLPDAQQPAETEPSAKASQNFEAFDAGEELVASAIARGAWTRNDRRELLRLSQGMSPEQLSALQLQVAQAVNQDRLVPERP